MCRSLAFQFLRDSDFGCKPASFLPRCLFLCSYYSPTASGFTGLETSACPMIIIVLDVAHDSKLSRTKANFSKRQIHTGTSNPVSLPTARKQHESWSFCFPGPWAPGPLVALTNVFTQTFFTQECLSFQSAQCVELRCGRGGDSQPQLGCRAAQPKSPHLLFLTLSLVGSHLDTEDREPAPKYSRDPRHLITTKHPTSPAGLRVPVSCGFHVGVL